MRGGCGIKGRECYFHVREREEIDQEEEMASRERRKRRLWLGLVRVWPKVSGRERNKPISEK